VLGDDAVPRLAAPRQGELPLSLCWEETLHTIFYRLGMAQRLGLKRVPLTTGTSLYMNEAKPVMSYEELGETFQRALVDTASSSQTSML